MDFRSFIQEVKSYPELYDQKNVNYTYFIKKEFIWQQISQKYQIQAKRKWSSLRDRYVKHKKKIDLKNDYDEPTWEYFEDMKFLDEHLLKNRKKPNLSTKIKRDNNSHDEEEEYLENIQENIHVESVETIEDDMFFDNETNIIENLILESTDYPKNYHNVEHNKSVVYEINTECKCGQVYIDNGKLLFVCEFCVNVFEKSENFLDHIMTIHNSINQNKFINDINMDEKQDIAKEEHKIEIMEINENEYKEIIDINEDENDEITEIFSNKLEYRDSQIIYPEYQENFIDFQNNNHDDKSITSPTTNNIEYEILDDDDDNSTFTEELNDFDKNINNNFNIDPNNQLSILSASTNLPKLPSKELNEDNEYFCTMCDKTYTIYKSLQNHFRICHSTPNICNICGKSFYKNEILITHIKNEHLKNDSLTKNNKQIINNCDDSNCDDTFTSNILEEKLKDNFNNNHIKTDDKNPFFIDQPERIKDKNGRFICTKCHITYARFENIKIHYRKNHVFEYYTIEKPLKQKLSQKCDVCNKIFKSKCQLRLHMNIHNNKRPYKCKICGVDFTHPQYLNYHIRIHTNDKRYPCDYCDKKFIRKFDKIYHMRSQHTMEKPAQCDDCGQTFTKYAQLTIHKNKYHNPNYIKPEYICDICNKKLTTYQAMKYHKLIHTGEKPHKCNICLLTFRKRSNLKTHEKIHSDIKEYLCKLCGKQFSQSAGLSIHMKTHGESLFDKKHRNLDKNEEFLSFS